MRAQDGGDRAGRELAGRLVAADERQLERQLVQPVGARRRRAAAGRRRAARAASRSRPRSPAMTVARSPMSTGRRASAAPTVRASSASRSGAAKSVASKTRVGERAERARPPARRRAAPATRGRRLVAPDTRPPTGAGRVRRLVGRRRLLGLAGHAGLVGAGGDVAVGGAAPVAVQRAVEDARRRARAGARRAGPGDRQAEPRRRSTLTQPGRRAGELAEARERGLVGRRALAAGGDVAVGVAGEQQPRERRVPAVPDAAHQMTAWCLRAGQRDVGEPQVLAALLLDVPVLVALVVGAGEADVDRAAVAARRGRGRRSASALSSTQVGSHRYGT